MELSPDLAALTTVAVYAVVWGFLFAESGLLLGFLLPGDTILFGDTGRDDLPGGDAGDHFESVEKLKRLAEKELILLPGHDHKGGRASSWATQLRINPSLAQDRETFIREAESFNAPAPRILKESLRANFK